MMHSALMLSLHKAKGYLLTLSINIWSWEFFHLQWFETTWKECDFRCYAL